jgi:hypothetical protein
VKLKAPAAGAAGPESVSEIEILDEEDVDEELRGVLDAVDAAGRTLGILGFVVQLDPEGRIEREGAGTAEFADLAVGLRVRVDGRRDEAGVFHAGRVRIRSSQYPERRLVGRLDAIEPLSATTARIRVLGRDLIVSDSTDLIAGGATRRALIPRALGFRNDEDLRFLGRYRAGEHLAFSGEFRLKDESLSNPDLETGTADGENVPELFLILGAKADFGRVGGLLEVQGDRVYFLRGGDPQSAPERRGLVRVSQAYVQTLDLGAPGLSFWAGRRQLKDERGFWYDTKALDSAGVFVDLAPVTIEASVSRDLFDKELNAREQDRTNVIGHVAWNARRDLSLEAFYIDRHDRTRLEDSPRHAGLRAIGKAGKRVEFALDVAAERGTRGRLDTATGEYQVRPVRAWACDGSVTIRPRWALDPSLTAGLAAASGDEAIGPSGATSATDNTFRQSGLQRNRGSWNGVVSFRTYGEVFAPELANLRIQTLGIGLRPLRPLSFDLVWHRYRQDRAAPRLERSGIDADPEGLDPALGTEWNLIAGWEPHAALELRLTAGQFRPGPAFNRHATTAGIATFQAKFRF